MAGIMSGTSLDGIDVAVVDIAGKDWNKRVETLATGFVAYPSNVRKLLLEVSTSETAVSQVGLLHFLLAELYARAVKTVCARSRIALKRLELAGCHGQTILHIGNRTRFLGHQLRCTLQIGDGSVLAERLGIPVVSDFRPRDMAAGGQGAPLVPYVDYLLLRHPKRGRVALNLGGIANITSFPAAARPEQVLAFDTGPGNMVIDALVGTLTRGVRQYDRNGEIASRGKASRWLLRILLRDPYFRRPPPKSAGREEYGPEFVRHLISTQLPLEDLVATASALTTSSIVLGIRKHILPRHPVHELIVSGGGAHNPHLMGLLREELPELAILPASDLGIDVDAKEAVAFAVLAYETWNGSPSNLPSATGASRAVVLGKISPGPARRRSRKHIIKEV